MNLQDRQNAMGEVNAQINAMSTAVSAAAQAGKIDNLFVNQWNEAVVAPWGRFMLDNWTADELLWESGIEDQITRYQALLETWREKLEKVAGKNIAPPPPPKEEQGGSTDGVLGGITDALTPNTGGESITAAAKHVAQGAAVGIVAAGCIWLAFKLRKLFGVPV